MNRPGVAASLSAVVTVALVGMAACKKEAPPAPPPATPAPPAAPVAAKKPAEELPKISCPDPLELLTPFLADLGPPADKDGKPVKKPANKKAAGKVSKATRTDCVVFAPGRFWLAAALSYDEKTGKNPRLAMLSGSPHGRTMVFEIPAIDPAPIEKLIAASKEVGVRIRKTRDDQSLVRLGVTGGPGGESPDMREVGLLLQLVAHQPPKLLWMGEGDQVTQTEDCVIEQSVDFELLFRTRLERFNVSKVRPGKDGKTPAGCQASPSTQESIDFRPVALPSGRAFDPSAAAAKEAPAGVK